MDIGYTRKSANYPNTDQAVEPEAAGLIGQVIQRLERLLSISTSTGSILYETRSREFGHEPPTAGGGDEKARPNIGRAETIMRLLDDLQRSAASNRDAAEALLHRL